MQFSITFILYRDTKSQFLYSVVTYTSTMPSCCYEFTPFFLWLDSPIWARASSFRRGFTVTLFRHTTFGRTHLDEGPARRRDFYLTTHNTHKRQTSMPPVGFFFFACPGFFPLWSIFVLFKFFLPSCHFTFHIIVLTTNTTQTSMPPVGFFFL
jgi:hypothetical protein